MRRYVPGLLGFVLLAVAALAWQGDPDAIDLTARLAGPSVRHPLGTDHLGRDVAARILSGAGPALVVMTMTIAIGLTLGAAIGVARVLAPTPLGYLIGRLADFALAVPPLVLALVIAATVGLTPAAAGAVLSIATVAGTAQVAEGLIRASAAAQHVLAARALGATPLGIVRRHILPEVLPALLLLQGYHAAHALIAWSGLTFLGLGGDPSRAEWGAMVWEYRLHLFEHPHLPLLPAAAIGATAWIFGRLGDPVRRAVRPDPDILPSGAPT